MPETQAQPQTQTQTQTQTQAPVRIVKEQPFGVFALSLTFFIVLAIFCMVYLNIRRKRGSKHVDEKAGDEGED